MSQTQINMGYVKKRITENINVSVIAKEINVSRNTLYGRIKRELGKEFKINNKIKETEDLIVEVKKMLQEGCTTREMCNKTGKCIDTVLKYKNILIARGEIEIYKAPIKQEETKITKEIPKQYEKKNISYSGWPYRMCGTWGF